MSSCGKAEDKDPIGVYIIFLCIFLYVSNCKRHVLQGALKACPLPYGVVKSEAVISAVQKAVCNGLVLMEGAKAVSSAGEDEHTVALLGFLVLVSYVGLEVDAVIVVS